jgi:hypothetical protein
MDDLHQTLGRIEGKLDFVVGSLREHIVEDTRRFTETGVKLDMHAADINKAKGAKSAVLVLATGAGAVASSVAWALGKIFGLH